MLQPPSSLISPVFPVFHFVSLTIIFLLLTSTENLIFILAFALLLVSILSICSQFVSILHKLSDSMSTCVSSYILFQCFPSFWLKLPVFYFIHEYWLHHCFVDHHFSSMYNWLNQINKLYIFQLYTQYSTNCPLSIQ